MKEEFLALQCNETWTLLPFPPDITAIVRKKVIRVKENPDGTVQKYKAQIVVKGFNQQHWFDFNETFSSVIKPISIWIILTSVPTYNLQVVYISIGCS